MKNLVTIKSFWIFLLAVQVTPCNKKIVSFYFSKNKKISRSKKIRKYKNFVTI